jgi:N-acetylmuramoyl-L-alanine amidase
MINIQELLNDTFGHLADQQIMALTIFGESRGEPDEGKIAVGSVILERVKKQGWMGKTISEVCLKPYQFSCYLPNDPNFPALKLLAGDWQNKYVQSPDLQNCYQLADGLIDGEIPETPEIEAAHAYQYVTNAMLHSAHPPKWAGTMSLIVVIGGQSFFA